MEIKQLYYFVKTCETMSIASAADSLFITPQALSKSIIKLEKELGAKLFHRYRQSLKLTEYGQAIHKEALIVVSEFEKFEQKTQAITSLSSGKIRIGRIASTEDYLIDNAILTFLGEHPDIKMEIKEMPRMLIEESILLQKIDLGICMKFPHHETTFDCRPIIDDHTCCIMCKTNSLYEKEELYVEDLKDRIIIKHTDMEPIENIIESKCEELGFELNWQMQSSYVPLNRSYMHIHDAIAFHPRRNCDVFKFTDYVGYRPFAKSENLGWKSHIIMAKERYPSKNVQLFLKHIGETALSK